MKATSNRIDQDGSHELQMDAREALAELVRADGDLIECFNALISVVEDRREEVVNFLNEDDPAEAGIKECQYHEIIMALKKIRNNASIQEI